MSAYHIPEDWRFRRIRYALESGALDIPLLAIDFDLDLEETIELVEEAAYELGVYFVAQNRAVFH